jgi:hypothetical protein
LAVSSNAIPKLKEYVVTYKTQFVLLHLFLKMATEFLTFWNLGRFAIPDL